MLKMEIAEEKESFDSNGELADNAGTVVKLEPGVPNDTNFVWQDYLEVTNSKEVPHVLFQHVEAGLNNELENGMVLEVPLKEDPNKYWLAKVVLACGPFSRLRYLGDADDQSADFWCDLTTCNGHPLGWSIREGKDLTPPAAIAINISEPKAYLEEVMRNAKSIPAHLLGGDGFAPVDRIKQGMKVEIQDTADPYNLWIATIIENVGGRLLLRYDTPDSSAPEFWLYFTSPRIFPMGWSAEKGEPWELRRPTNFSSAHGKEEWEALMEMAKEDARRSPLPNELFIHSTEIPPHSFTLGMQVEALHPKTLSEVAPATVVEVWGDSYFLVELDGKVSNHEEEDVKLSWLCTANHAFIFPVGWASKHGVKIKKPKGWKEDTEEDFQWDEYLQYSCGVTAPESCFPHKPVARQLGFHSNMKLEAVNPADPSEICVATVVRTSGHIVWLHLEKNESGHPDHAVSCHSLDIFPVGWCDSNSYPLKPPLYYQMPSTSCVTTTEEEGVERKDCDPSHGTSKLWCPKIYFNHKCFSGPFLSKSKLAGLPQAVGPGPVRLVMREVLAMLISVAYKSSRVLRELQCDGDLRPGEHLEVLKAKYNQTNYRARVAVVTSSDQVAEFCQDVCARLKLCPYLFGPTRVESGSCPEMCSSQSKTKFTQYWLNRRKNTNRPSADPPPELEVVGPKKKRGRKKRFGNAKTTRSSAASSLSPHGGDSDGSGDSGPVENSNAEIQENTPHRREMITRGAKLAPNSGHSAPRQVTDKRGTKRTHNDNDNDHKTLPKVEVPAPGSWLYPLPIIHSNPLLWTAEDVEDYLNNTSDCHCLSKLLRKEAFDGRSFMLLNLPTALSHLKLKPDIALQLCRHVARVKFVFLKKYVYHLG